MKNIIRVSLTVAVAFFGFNQTIFAQHNHGSHGGHSGHDGTTHVHSPPHQGQLKKSGKYEFEMVHSPMSLSDPLCFYIYKSSHKVVLNHGISGTVTYTKKDGTKITEKLKPMGDQKFIAQALDSEVIKTTAQFVIKSKTYMVDFAMRSITDGQSNLYTCVMHPQIEESKAGTCSICGMNLTKK